ncbi:haloacid dehalogenase-like hydrolase domain-containing 5 isoform X2 [Phyllopteryx taeniolatus]|uniref:haloacid dehalogenase-like hydrolase domain-containing 5 isoform X2 n=1 Tax=Phyllopteryx taeniolatus TaxID=161469 RepID=UPI002AD1EC26|nr:haloacid dehalogenase-like hydrolase domain-containing 5 isoform X2 [Phyllopteryx taeniolatus]
MAATSRRERAVAPPVAMTSHRSLSHKGSGTATVVVVVVVMWAPRLRHALRAAAAARSAVARQRHGEAGEAGEAGILLDVDGVLLRGGRVIPAARRAFRKLLDADGRFLFPTVFVTNAGSCQPQRKAQQLSALLDVRISPDQVVLSYSPLRMLSSFHDKRVLVSGQGPVSDIARSLGFKKVVSVEKLCEQHPLLDMVDHNRRPRPPSELQPESAQIEAVVLFGEPVRWETNLQLLLDVLLTDGRPSRAYRPPAVQLPVLACNLDLLWMARAPSPRLGHGMFLLCLESAYKKLTGAELRYEALLGKPGLLTYRYARRALTRSNRHREVQTIYAIGDNPMTDVYGANLYDRYLARQHKRARPATGSQAGAAEPDEEEPAPPAARCRSVLVCTGVYGRPSASAPAPESVFLHGHRDMTAEAGLAEPSYVVDDVEAAVDLVLRRHL